MALVTRAISSGMDWLQRKHVRYDVIWIDKSRRDIDIAKLNNVNYVTVVFGNWRQGLKAKRNVVECFELISLTLTTKYETANIRKLLQLTRTSFVVCSVNTRAAEYCRNVLIGRSCLCSPRWKKARQCFFSTVREHAMGRVQALSTLPIFMGRVHGPCVPGFNPNWSVVAS